VESPTELELWALEAGGPDEPSVIWSGTLPGGLFRSTDHGQSWEMIRALWDHPKRKQWMGGGADLPGIHSICVDPRNSRRVWVAVSTGGIWFTEDAGASWTQRGEGMRAEHVPPELTHDPIAQDVHCLVQCPAAPYRMWVQHHNGIFVSSDEGKTFSEISGVEPSTFGVPEIKDEKRIPPDGKLIVTRTRDGGKSFDFLTKGLPQSHAYDVVYRHALALDEAGDRLAFGSTTGGLWVSEDQGDRWACVTHTLPPIYSVRFA
jgi:Sortilin, neurotensin receptor 3,